MKNTIKNTILFTLLFTAFCGQILTAQTGSVGIGETNPTEAKLVVKSASGVDALFLNNRMRFESIDGSKIALWGGVTSMHGFGVSAGQLNYHVPSGNSHVFYDGGLNGDGTENMRIAGNGNVSINTNLSVGQDLTVNDDLNVSSTAVIGSTLTVGPNNIGDPNVAYIKIANNAQSKAGHFRNIANGDGVTVSITNNGSNGGGTVVALQINGGSAAKPGGGMWEGTSDRRLKQDIMNYQKGLAELRSVQPVTYRYNEKTDFNTQLTHVGIIAQDLQKIAPDMVQQRGEYLTVDASAFTYMLINAVQEQDQIITDQQKEIDALKARLDRIEAMLKK